MRVGEAARERAAAESVLKEEEAKGLNELEEARKKLAHMGLSPMGYEWIPASVRNCIDGGSLHVG